jgi:hypothetical protein
MKTKQMALEALKNSTPVLGDYQDENAKAQQKHIAAIAALEAAIAQPVEPVAWRKKHQHEHSVSHSFTEIKDHVDEWAQRGVFLEPLYTTPPEPAVNAELLEALKQALPFMESESVINGYGYYRTENPNDFHPDHDLCSEGEIANHKAACAAYDAGNYCDDYDDGWLSPNLHVTKAPWGIGSYSEPIPELVAQCERARAAVAKVEKS